MTNVLKLDPPRRALKQTAITPDDALAMGLESDLSEVLVLGRTKGGDLFYRGARLGVHAQSRTDLSRLCQSFLDELLANRIYESR